MRRRKFPAVTDDEVDFMRRNVAKMTDQKMSALLCRMYGAGRWTEERVGRVRLKHGITKGRKHDNRALPVGTVKAFRKNGTKRMLIKVGANPYRWELYSRHVWREQRGPIPAGHSIIHVDGDPLNCDVSNLRCVSRSEHGRWAQKSLVYDEAHGRKLSEGVSRSRAYAKRKKAAEIYLAHKPYEFAR